MKSIDVFETADSK